jgi:hypothetical protein
MSLLCYRFTPFPWCNISPAELLMGRRLRTNLPLLQNQLIPKWDFPDNFRQQHKNYKMEQKLQHDRCHRALPLSPIPNNTEVYINTSGQVAIGQVVSSADAPRSYIVDTSSGLLRRNRRHPNIIPSGSSTPDPGQETEPTAPNHTMTRSRTGTTTHPPDRLTSPEKGKCGLTSTDQLRCCYVRRK